jgi:hypothetical protein
MIVNAVFGSVHTGRVEFESKLRRHAVEALFKLTVLLSDDVGNVILGERIVVKSGLHVRHELGGSEDREVREDVKDAIVGSNESGVTILGHRRRQPKMLIGPQVKTWEEGQRTINSRQV